MNVDRFYTLVIMVYGAHRGCTSIYKVETSVTLCTHSIAQQNINPCNVKVVLQFQLQVTRISLVMRLEHML